MTGLSCSALNLLVSVIYWSDYSTCLNHHYSVPSNYDRQLNQCYQSDFDLPPKRTAKLSFPIVNLVSAFF